MKQPVIISAAHTPIGSFQGKLGDFSATRLGSIVIGEVLRRARLKADQVDEVIMGNVLLASLGRAPPRR
jgi:acetyl-CoA C-acetyltransferase